MPVIPDDTIRKLLASCSGRSFEDRRDTPILFVLIDSGARLSEVADLRLDKDLDLEFDELQVTGKGRRGPGFLTSAPGRHNEVDLLAVSHSELQVAEMKPPDAFYGSGSQKECACPRSWVPDD